MESDAKEIIIQIKKEKRTGHLERFKEREMHNCYEEKSRAKERGRNKKEREGK